MKSTDNGCLKVNFGEVGFMFQRFMRIVQFSTIIMLIGMMISCPNDGGGVKDDIAPSLATTQDGIQDGDSSFQIQFTENVQLVSGMSLSEGITIAVNAGSPVSASSASINSDTKYVDIGLPAVVQDDKIVIVIRQGYLQDAPGNKNSQLTMPTITVSAPSSDKTSPALAEAQENFEAGSKTYSLTFTENLIMAVDTLVELASGIKKVIKGTESFAIAAKIDTDDSTKVKIVFSDAFRLGEVVTFM